MNYYLNLVFFIIFISLPCLAFDSSINLIFLNNEYRLAIDGKYPFDIDFKERIVDQAVHWAKLNPNAIIRVWFDYGVLDSEIVANAQDLLLEEAERNGVKGRVEQKNLQNLDWFKRYSATIFAPHYLHKKQAPVRLKLT